MALAFDAATTAKGKGSSLTFSHTTSGSNRGLIVGVAWENNFTDGAVRVTGVTYAGTAMTLVGQRNDSPGGVGLNVGQWKLSAPATGANNVVVSLDHAASEGMVAVATSFTDAHQTTASLTGTFASAEDEPNPPTVDVSSASDQIVVDLALVLMSVGQTISVGASQTQRANASQVGTLTDGVLAGVSTETGASTTTMSWSLGITQFNNCCAVPVIKFDPSQTVGPAGNIATAQAFGTDQLNLALPAAGNIASAQAFGTANMAQDKSISISGIGSSEALGDVIVGFTVPQGIQTEEGFGIPTLGLYLGPVGIITEESMSAAIARVFIEIPEQVLVTARRNPDLMGVAKLESNHAFTVN